MLFFIKNDIFTFCVHQDMFLRVNSPSKQSSNHKAVTFESLLPLPFMAPRLENMFLWSLLILSSLPLIVTILREHAIFTGMSDDYFARHYCTMSRFSAILWKILAALNRRLSMCNKGYIVVLSRAYMYSHEMPLVLTLFGTPLGSDVPFSWLTKCNYIVNCSLIILLTNVVSCH